MEHMKTLTQAAESLFKKGEITKDEHEMLNKAAGMFPGASKLVEAAAPSFKDAVKSVMQPRAFKDAAKSVMQPLAIGSLATLALSTILKPIIRQAQIGQSYDKLIEKNPILAEKDQNQVKDYFNVIKTFSPKAASNPLVAGALVNKMMEFGGVDHKLVQDIAAIESGIEAINPFETLATSATKAFVGGKD
jgi:hypothetical protein